jgi:hypothetical protein
MLVKYSKLPDFITTFSIPRSSKIYPNWDFWSEKKPSGNPGGAVKFILEIVKKMFYAKFCGGEIGSRKMASSLYICTYMRKELKLLGAMYIYICRTYFVKSCDHFHFPPRP